MTPDGGGEGAGMDEPLTPSPERTRALRDAFGRFATGVTLVTAAGPAGPVGLIANSFASVSLDPALVLWSPAKASRRFPVFAAAPYFAVHVLGAEQMDLCRRFAARGDDWEGLALATGAGGTPVLPGCLARFECAAVARHDAGDHLVVIGAVERFAYRRGAPLVFSAGAYGGFAEP